MKNISLKLLIIVILFVYSNCNAFSQEEVSSNEKSVLLESLGSLGSSNIFLTYLSLSLIEQKIVESSETTGLDDVLLTIVKLNDIAISTLREIKTKALLSQEDIDFVNKLEKAYSMLKDDALLLKTFLRTQVDADHTLFQSKHKELGDYLNELFKE